MIYDITQEVFTSVVYGDDTKPQRIMVRQMEAGELYNLTDIKMCAHNGTHVDAPRHFLRDGKGIDELSLDALVGECQVFSEVSELLCSDCERVLLKGYEPLTIETVEQLLRNPPKLLGVEGQSVGDMEVHKALLSREIVVLEGIRLDEVPDGRYLLFAAPLKLGGCDGAPCRAILLDGVI